MYYLPRDYNLLVSGLNNLFSYNSKNKTFKSEKAGSIVCVGDGQEERWIFLIYQEDLKGDFWNLRRPLRAKEQISYCWEVMS